MISKHFAHLPTMTEQHTSDRPPLKGIERIWYACIWTFGWVLSVLPVGVSKILCESLGWMVWNFSSRREVILSQLERAFPERPLEWRKNIGRRHCSRMFEMFLLIIVLKHWPEKKIRSRFQAGESLLSMIRDHADKRPVFFAIPHSALMESLTIIPLLVPEAPPIITLYRPLDSLAAEVYVNEARERWGADLVARREGLLKAKNHLASGKGIVGVLFDQSPGEFGHLLLFFDRTCTATNLPGLLITKASALTVFLHTRRDSFWKGTIEAEILPDPASVADSVISINQALEDHLRSNDEACANWLWAHKRWKGPQQAHLSLAFQRRKSYLPEQLKALGYDQLPKKTRIAVRLDPSEAMLTPSRQFLELIRSQRPDAVFSLLVPSPLIAEGFGEVEHYISLPAAAKQRKALFQSLREESFDLLFSLDPEIQAEEENRCLRAQTSIGVSTEESSRYRVSVQVDADTYKADPWISWKELLLLLGLPEGELDTLLNRIQSAAR